MLLIDFCFSSTNKLTIKNNNYMRLKALSQKSLKNCSFLGEKVVKIADGGNAYPELKSERGVIDLSILRSDQRPDKVYW